MMLSEALVRFENSLPIRFGQYTKDGETQKVIFIGHEKAIYDSDGTQLDVKLQNIKDSISDVFDEERLYAVGDYCIHDNTLCKFTAPKEAGPWDDSLITKVSITEELKSIRVYSTSQVVSESVSPGGSVVVSLGDLIPEKISRDKIVAIIPYVLNTVTHNTSGLALRSTNLTNLTVTFSVIGTGATQTFRTAFYVFYYE